MPVDVGECVPLTRTMMAGIALIMAGVLLVEISSAH